LKDRKLSREPSEKLYGNGGKSNSIPQPFLDRVSLPKKTQGGHGGTREYAPRMGKHLTGQKVENARGGMGWGALERSSLGQIKLDFTEGGRRMCRNDR